MKLIQTNRTSWTWKKGNQHTFLWCNVKCFQQVACFKKAIFTWKSKNSQKLLNQGVFSLFYLNWLWLYLDRTCW